MTDHVSIVNRVDAAIKRNGGDIPHLRTEINRLIDQFGERAVLDALIECAATATLRLAFMARSDCSPTSTGKDRTV